MQNDYYYFLIHLNLIKIDYHQPADVSQFQELKEAKVKA